MANNIPLGTYLSDGIRTGPNFADTQPGPLSPRVNVAGVPSASASIPSVTPYTQYGKGVLHSSLITYTITPALACDGLTTAGLTLASGNPVYGGTAGDIGVVPRQTALYGGWVPLNGNNLSAKKYANPQAPSGLGTSLQLDYPRCLQFSFGLPAADSNLTFSYNIFGYDLYGFQMYEYGEIDSQPVAGIAGPGSAVQYFWITGNKAFYGVTGVYITVKDATGLAPVPSISISTSNKFGLPQRLYSLGDIVSISGGNQCAIDSNPVGQAGTNIYGTSDPSTAAFSALRGVFPGSTPGVPPINNFNPTISSAAVGNDLSPYGLATQSFFYNDAPCSYPAPLYFDISGTSTIQSGGPAHVATARDVRGTFDITQLLSGFWTGLPTTLTAPTYMANQLYPRWGSNVAPQTFSITYVVRGADTGLNQAYDYRQSDQYLANQTPNPKATPNTVPLLPNTFLTIPNVPQSYVPDPTASQPTVPTMPLMSIDQYGVAQYYQKTPLQ